MPALDFNLYLSICSADATLRIWGLGPGACGRQRLRRSSVRRWTQQPLPSRPVRTLHGHSCAVVCLAADADLDVVVSGGADGWCIIHRLSQGVILHSVSPEGDSCSPNLCRVFRGLVLTRDGEIVMTLGDGSLRTIDVNRHVIGRKTIPEEGPVLSSTLSADGAILFSSGKDGPISARSARTLQTGGNLPAETVRKDGFTQPAVVPALSLALSPCGGYVFAGLEDGCIDYFTSSRSPEQVPF